MKSKQSQTFSVKNILTAGGFVCASALLLSMIIALLIVEEILPMQYAGITVPIITAISVFGTLAIYLKRVGEKKVLFALAAASIYFIIILLVKLFFIPGQVHNMLLIALIVFPASLLSAFVTSPKNKNKRKWR